MTFNLTLRLSVCFFLLEFAQVGVFTAVVIFHLIVCQWLICLTCRYQEAAKWLLPLNSVKILIKLYEF